MECDKMKEFNHRWLIFFVVVYFFYFKKKHYLCIVKNHCCEHIKSQRDIKK